MISDAGSYSLTCGTETIIPPEHRSEPQRWVIDGIVPTAEFPEYGSHSGDCVVQKYELYEPGRDYLSDDFDQAEPNNDDAEDGQIKFELASDRPHTRVAAYAYQVVVTADGGSVRSETLTLDVICGAATVTEPELAQEVTHEIDGE